MPDAHEAFREDVQQEAAQELIERQSHQLLFVVVSGITPTERDLAFSKGDEAMVGDGHAMGVAAQIVEHMFVAAERSFGVHHPVLSEQRSQPRGEGLWLSERLQTSVEIELASPEGAFESCNKLAAKNTPEHFDGKKERMVRADPVGVVE